MNTRKLGKVLKAIQLEAKLDYAILKPDKLGDCMSCVNYELCELYDEDSKGIWVKHWTTGMNKGDAIKYLDKVYIAHDITEEQFRTIKEVFERNDYDVEPEQYNPYKCIVVSERKENEA